jgi:streptogramin lyase
MAKKPGDRYATAGELAADLGRALGVMGGEQALLEPSRFSARRRSRALIAAGGVLALALAAGLVLATRDGPPPTIPPAPIGVSNIDLASSRITLSTHDRTVGWDLVAAEGALWQTGPDGLVRRDDSTGQVVKIFDLGSEPNVVAAGFGAIWVTVTVSENETSLVRLDPATDEIVGTVNLSLAERSGENGIPWVTIDHQSVWVLTGEGTLWQIDPIANRIAQRYETITAPESFLTTGGGFIWLSNTLSDAIVRLDPATRKTDTILISSRPDQLAFVGGTLWAMDVEGHTVTPIDAALLEAGAPVGIPNDPTLMVGGLGWLWVPADHVVARINPVTGQVHEMPVDFWVSAVAPDDRTGTIWVLRQPD